MFPKGNSATFEGEIRRIYEARVLKRSVGGIQFRPLKTVLFQNPESRFALKNRPREVSSTARLDMRGWRIPCAQMLVTDAQDKGVITHVSDRTRRANS